MSTPRYAIGIDLGTTNSVLAARPLDDENAPLEVLPVPQLVAFGTVAEQPVLPSFLYQAIAAESAGGALDLGWARDRTYAVGELARRQAADVPTRTIAAAKSWLAHHGVDRHEPILPWQAPDDVPKISPIEAAQRYLEHLVAAWNARHPDAELATQVVVLTVPASFDASARELTREAALAAGLPQETILLEEPQAATYAWLADAGESWRDSLTEGDVLLVCDIGGGTTDFTLVRVEQDAGELALRRIAVGNHILVGGDNMDLSLAHHVSTRLADAGTSIDAWQSVALWHACRSAKEALLTADGPAVQPITIAGRGSRLIGGAVTTELGRDEVQELLIDGFFPHCAATDAPSHARASGFQELGLPFESDPAITRHLARFLYQQQDGDAVWPTRVLFNGGCLKGTQLRRRLLEVIASWHPTGGELLPLDGTPDLDFAVARGAAHYAYTRERGGVRIRGGTARAYYVGIESTGLAVPGVPRPLRALCVVPFGTEEGTSVEVPGSEVGLVVGQAARFRFFGSAVRKHDRPGQLLERIADDELQETDALETTLATDDADGETFVPVRFESRITELGVLELWCASTRSDRRWKLEFSVRHDAPTAR